MIRVSRLTARPLTARKLIAYKLGQTGPFDPLILFRNAETGTFLDFTPTHVCADTAGTDPAEVGEGIAFVDDKSPNDTDATQATSTARPIFRLTSGVYNAEFDLTDDILPITLPAITGGTVALVGLSGIWIEDNWDYAGGTLFIGPTTIAGLPAGILGVVGDLCAVIINDRAWTAAERAGVVAWGKARGAPGVFSLGPELVTNGDFSDGATGWIYPPGSGTQSTFVGGSAQIISSDGSYQAIAQNVLTAGERYKVTVDVVAITTAGAGVRARLGVYTQFNFTTTGTKAVLGTASDATLLFDRSGGVTNITIDNASARKLELLP